MSRQAQKERIAHRNEPRGLPGEAMGKHLSDSRKNTVCRCGGCNGDGTRREPVAQIRGRS